MSVFAIIAGLLLIVVGRAYATVFHPEWTDMLAAVRLWWLWLFALMLIAGGSVLLFPWRND